MSKKKSKSDKTEKAIAHDADEELATEAKPSKVVAKATAEQEAEAKAAKDAEEREAEAKKAAAKEAEEREAEAKRAAKAAAKEAEEREAEAKRAAKAAAKEAEEREAEAKKAAKAAAREAEEREAEAKKAAAKSSSKGAPAVKAGSKRRAVVVGGMRTPFVRAFSEFTKLDTIALGVLATKALLEKFDIPRNEIDSIIWGGVIFPPTAPNLAREIALDLKLPAHVEGMTCTRACASGLQAVTLAAAAIERGEADVVIAGGSDSTSNASLTFPTKMTHLLAPLALGKGPTPADILGVLAQMVPLSEVLPSQPKISERTTGEVMGESAEKMAKRNGITRQDQDEFAVRSHQRAARAVESGRFADEIVPVKTREGAWVHTDRIVRGDTSVARLSKLRPAFAADGTVTAGNASALTDGAAAVLLMSEEKAKALGYAPLAAFRSWAYSAVDPSDQLLIGPALAMPKALDRAGVGLSDIDMVDMHEAFAAQVLSVLKMLGSSSFARERLGRDKAIGEVSTDILNLHGGSLALGHPFGATGARMVTTVANELSQGKRELALLGICAAGGLGAAAVMEAL
ncbi:MAG: acetyl-CoA C-acyltransferase [Myxococcales bacterium]